MTLNELAKAVDAEVVGDGAVVVSSTNTLEDAAEGQVSFLANPRYERQLATTKASAVIVGLDVARPGLNLLRATDPYYAFSKAVVALHGYRKHPHEGIHPQAYVDPTATVGEGTVIYPHVYVGPRAKIGRDCILYPCAVVYDDCVLGDRVTLHAGASIGQDGFGYATHRGVHHKIPQAGNSVIEDDVEIGANVAIQRATMGSTVIGQGTKMSDLVAIGHATTIGPHGLIVSLAGIAGSTKIGHHVVIGGQAGIVGHAKIGDMVVIAAQSGVINDVPDKTTMIGAPANPTPYGRKQVTLQGQLPDLAARIKKLEQQVEAMMGSQGEKETG